MQQRVAKNHALLVAKCVLVSAIVAVGVLLPAQRAEAEESTTTVTAKICSGPTTLAVNSPVNNSVVSASPITIDTTTSWATSLVVSEGANVLATTPLSDQTNYAASTSITLTPGTHTYTITAKSSCQPADDVTSSLTVTYTQDGVTVDAIVTSDTTPTITGTTLNPTSQIYVMINGVAYRATNNANGTWTLPGNLISPPLAEGQYSVQVVTVSASAPVPPAGQLPAPPHLTNNTFAAAVTIDTTAPTGSVTTPPSTDSRSPAFGGTVSDPTAVVTITINGNTYTAVNNGNGTWSLPAGVIEALANGTYPYTVTIRDAAGNTTTVTGTILIEAAGQISFVAAPDTGYMRIGNVNVYTKYLLALLLLLLAAFVATFVVSGRSPIRIKLKR